MISKWKRRGVVTKICLKEKAMVRFQLPFDFEGGNILGMGRDPIKNQTPDLFSTGRLDGSPPNNRRRPCPGGRPAEWPFPRIYQGPFDIWRTKK